MKRLLIGLATSSTILFGQGFNSDLSSTLGIQQTKKLNRIIVENRVLATVNNTPISVYDVMKKMDLEFYMMHPHLMDSDVARYQFYSSQWRPEFDRMIDNELLLSDAKAHKIELTDGDLRQEIEQRFGPDVISTIDHIGLTYDETVDMVKKDILTQRMAHGYLYLKGVFSVSPEDLLYSYHQYIENHKKPDRWNYYMISFNGPNALEDAQIAKQKLDKMLQESKNFKSVCYRFQEQMPSNENRSIQISDEFELPSDKIHEAHRTILSQLTPHSISEPKEEISRRTKQPIYRLFYLASYEPGGTIELAEVEDKLVLDLKRTKFEQEYQAYITKLREQTGLTKEIINESIPSDFEPFKIR